MHGARGGAPEGERNGNYRHGARTKEAIELGALIRALGGKNENELFDHLIRADQDGHREGEAKRFCCPSIDDQLKKGGSSIGMSPGLVPFSILSIK